MSDITKCPTTDCPMRLKCHRFTDKDGEFQSYFSRQPSEVVDGYLTCELFWGENAQDVWGASLKGCEDV